MTVEILKSYIQMIATEYPIKRVELFGSRAEGINREDSDVDLIIEFFSPVSLLTLSSIKLRLGEMLNVEVDIIHGPLRETDLIEVGKIVELYAA